jgi:hypothetical protein
MQNQTFSNIFEDEDEFDWNNFCFIHLKTAQQLIEIYFIELVKYIGYKYMVVI